MSGNAFGRLSQLSVTTACHGGQTTLENVYFTAPFKIMHPFYPPKRMQLMVLTASAGIMAGDQQQISYQIRAGSQVEVISQAFEKIHNMEGASASRTIQIKMEKNSLLVYHPQPAIPYKGSAFFSRLEAEIEPGSRLVLCDILTCGRKSSGESFAYRFYENLVQVKRSGHLIYRDYARFHPQEMDMWGMGMYEGYTHLLQLTLFGFHWDSSALSSLGDFLQECPHTTGAFTRLSDTDVAIRVLGNTAQELMDLSSQILSPLWES